MTTLPRRLSPIHDELEHLHPTWGEVGETPVAVHFGKPADERRAARTLGLCDASALPRLTLKGPGAETLLGERGVPVPAGFAQVQALPGGGLVARTGGTEFFIEDGVRGGVVVGLDAASAGRPGIYPLRRQDASFLLSGSSAHLVLAQTCGYDFRQPAPALIFTRVAGVSCSILSRQFSSGDGPIAAFQLWLDGTFGIYLWEQLLTIAGELGGSAVGMSSFFPDLTTHVV